jgi:hypothetical protein
MNYIAAKPGVQSSPGLLVLQAIQLSIRRPNIIVFFYFAS